MMALKRRWAVLARGGVMLSLVTALPLVSFNQVWFDLILGVLSLIVTLLLGGDASGMNNGSL